MMPAVGDWPGLFALVLVAVVLWGLLLGPFIAIYCLVRFLRDVRRIAVALEAANTPSTRVAHMLDESPESIRTGTRREIVNSIFSR